MYSYIRLSDLLWHLGNNAASLDNARKEIPTAQKLTQLDPADPENQLLLAMCYVDQGFKEAELGDQAAGLEILDRGASMFEQMVAEHPEDLSQRRRLALAYGRIADIQRHGPKGNDSDSLASFRKAIATLQPLLPKDPNNAEVRRMLAYYHHASGELLDDMNQRPAALAQEHEALTSFQNLAAADPTNVQLQQDIANVHRQIGILLTETGEPAKAIAELEESARVLEKAGAGMSPASYYGYRLIADQFWLGKAHAALASSARLSAAERAEHCRQARSWFQRCLPQFESLRDKGPDYDADATVAEIHRQMPRCSSPNQ